MAENRSAGLADRWAPFRFFLGRWRGAGSGKPGESQAEREYRFVLGERFIRLEGRSVYEPQERNPDGEVHDEFGYLSYDEGRAKYVLREFHVEGFVNQYVLEEQDDGRRMVFMTEAIENIAPGWSARTTCEILDENHFRETFDLAGPGREWDCYIINEFERL